MKNKTKSKLFTWYFLLSFLTGITMAILYILGFFSAIDKAIYGTVQQQGPILIDGIFAILFFSVAPGFIMISSEQEKGVIFITISLIFYYLTCWLFWHFYSQMAPLVAVALVTPISTIRAIGYRQDLDGYYKKNKRKFLSAFLYRWQIGNEKNDVFISYRRDGGDEMARLIKNGLEAEGISCFLDVDDLGASHFDERLIKEIEKRPNFLVILSKGALDRCIEENDWMRKEISHAIKTERNIVPILIPELPDTGIFPSIADLPVEIASLPRYNSVIYSHEYYGNMMHKLMKFIE